MKIQEVVENYGYYDERSSIEILIDGKRVFYVHDGEPEDNNLSRNFSACYTIVELLKRAYEAGKRGEPFEEQE